MVVDTESLRLYYTEEGFKSVLSALRILGDMKFFDALVALNNQVLLEGFEVEDPDALARKILETRQTNRVFLAIRDLAPPTEEGSN